MKNLRFLICRALLGRIRQSSFAHPPYYLTSLLPLQQSSNVSSPSAGLQQRQQIGGRLQLSRSLFVPYRQSAVQHHAGKHPHLLCTLQFHPTSGQKKPGGGQGEMETITILAYQPLIDLEVSTPSRCVAPSTPPFRALQKTAANIHSIH